MSTSAVELGISMVSCTQCLIVRRLPALPGTAHGRPLAQARAPRHAPSAPLRSGAPARRATQATCRSYWTVCLLSTISARGSDIQTPSCWCLTFADGDVLTNVLLLTITPKAARAACLVAGSGSCAPCSSTASALPPRAAMRMLATSRCSSRATLRWQGRASEHSRRSSLDTVVDKICWSAHLLSRRIVDYRCRASTTAQAVQPCVAAQQAQKELTD